MSSTADAPLIPSAYTTALISVIVVFLILATIAVGVRVYASRISSRDRWMTKDLWLIIGALAVCYGSIIANVTGAAVVGLNVVGTRLSLTEAAEFTFKVNQQLTMSIIFLTYENRSTLQMSSLPLLAVGFAKFRFSSSTSGYLLRKVSKSCAMS